MQAKLFKVKSSMIFYEWQLAGLIINLSRNLTALSVKDNDSTFQIVPKSAVKCWFQKLRYRLTIYIDQDLDKQRNFMQTSVF